MAPELSPPMHQGDTQLVTAPVAFLAGTPGCPYGPTPKLYWKGMPPSPKAVPCRGPVRMAPYLASWKSLAFAATVYSGKPAGVRAMLCLSNPVELYHLR